MGVQLDGIIPRRRWKMNIAAFLCLDMECPQWYNKDDIVHLSARTLREKSGSARLEARKTHDAGG